MDRLLTILKAVADFFSMKQKGVKNEKAIKAINARTDAMDDYSRYDGVSNSTDIYRRD